MLLLKTNKDYTRAFPSLTPIMVSVNDFINSFQSTSEIPLMESLKESELTHMCMSVSEKSFQKIWEDEDDAKWERFLKD